MDGRKRDGSKMERCFLNETKVGCAGGGACISVMFVDFCLLFLGVIAFWTS